MNDESLEQYLRNLPAPELPETWRDEILSKALREAAISSRSQQIWPTLFVYLRHLFRQNPLTTSAMTVLWILIFVFKASTPIDPSSKQLLVHVDPNRPIYFVSISEEIRLAQLWQDEPEQRQIP